MRAIAGARAASRLRGRPAAERLRRPGRRQSGDSRLGAARRAVRDAGEGGSAGPGGAGGVAPKGSQPPWLRLERQARGLATRRRGRTATEGLAPALKDGQPTTGPAPRARAPRSGPAVVPSTDAGDAQPLGLSSADLLYILAGAGGARCDRRVLPGGWRATPAEGRPAKGMRRRTRVNHVGDGKPQASWTERKSPNRHPRRSRCAAS